MERLLSDTPCAPPRADLPVLLYLHGFRSSPAAWKSRHLEAVMAARGWASQFVCPALPTVPDAAIALCADWIQRCAGPVTVIGSSLGGHYAHHLAETLDLRAILINPAAVAALDLAPFIGRHRPHHGNECFDFTAEHAAQLQRQLRPPTPERYWLLQEMGDRVLDYRQAQSYFSGCRQTVLPDGEHRFTRFPDFVPEILAFAGFPAASGDA